MLGEINAPVDFQELSDKSTTKARRDQTKGWQLAITGDFGMMECMMRRRDQEHSSPPGEGEPL